MQENKSKWRASSEQEVVAVWLSTVKPGSTVLAYGDMKTEGNKNNNNNFLGY